MIANLFKKMVKAFKSPPYMSIPEKIRIKTKDLESLFYYFYNAKLFNKWFSLPGMFFLSKNEHFNAGTIIKCVFPFFPFWWFNVRVNKIEEFKCFEGEFYGLMNGFLGYYIKDITDEDCLFYYDVKIRGSNYIWHILYTIFLKWTHHLQTNYVMKRLKKKFENDKYCKIPDTIKMELSKNSI